jgi:putative transposase
LGEVWRHVEGKYPFTTNAICLLPDHIHCLITLPEGDEDYPFKIQMIKSLFTKRYLRLDANRILTDESRNKRREACVWQRRYWEHTIRDQADFNAHLDYIHYNPVKHGYVEKVVDWQWSSFSRYLRNGLYDEEWGIAEPEKVKRIQGGE